MKKKSQFDGQRFYNPTLSAGHGKSFWQGLKMWYSTPKAVWPKFVPNKATPKLPLQVAPGEIAVTFVNHVTFLLQLPGLNILTDPLWSKRTSPLAWYGPKRVRVPGIALENLPKIDVILISHNHYDHMDLKTLAWLNSKFKPQIFIPLGDKRVLDPQKFKITELDWWDQQQLDAQTLITFTPTQHWSSRGLLDQYASLWGSYVIEHAGKKIYFGGDGGYSTHFVDIQQEVGDIDLSFLGIGAYEPRWFMRDMHTNPEEAVQAHLDLKSKQSIGMHFGTFQLSAEGIDQPLIDLNAAKAKFAVPDAAFGTMEVGETRIFKL